MSRAGHQGPGIHSNGNVEKSSLRRRHGVASAHSRSKPRSLRFAWWYTWWKIRDAQIGLRTCIPSYRSFAFVAAMLSSLWLFWDRSVWDISALLLFMMDYGARKTSVERRGYIPHALATQRASTIVEREDRQDRGVDICSSGRMQWQRCSLYRWDDCSLVAVAERFFESPSGMSCFSSKPAQMCACVRALASVELSRFRRRWWWKTPNNGLRDACG